MPIRSRLLLAHAFLLLAVCPAFQALLPATTNRRSLGTTAPATTSPTTDTPVVSPSPAELWPRKAIAESCLLSELDVDYAPLMEALRRGDFKQADQFTRDNLIRLAGPGALKRGFVYFTEARKLPATDLATMELLWQHYSDGKFGYTVQKKVWRLQLEDFENFCVKLGWTTTDADTGLERKRRWFGNSEFIYDLSAPKGHLPLTSALRGTQLLKSILNHAVWDTDEWMRDLIQLD